MNPSKNEVAPLNITKKQTRILWDALFVLLVVLSLYFLRQDIQGILPPFLYALVLSYFLNPLVHWLERKKIKRVLAILLVFLALFLLLYLLFLSFVPTLVREVASLAKEIPAIFAFLQEFIKDAQLGDLKLPAFLPEGLLDFLNLEAQFKKLADWTAQYLSELPSAVFGAMKSLLNLVMTPLITFYYLKDHKRFTGGLLGLFPDEAQCKIREGAGRIDQVLGGFIRGQLLVAIFVGTLTGLGSWVIGIPNATIIGLVSGLTNIIPYFGPFLGGILPVVLGLMNEPILALWVLILIAVVQQIEAALISPAVMSHSVGLHPLTVMFSVLLFGSAFGIPGMILAVPIAGTIKVLYGYVTEFRTNLRKPEDSCITEPVSFVEKDPKIPKVPVVDPTASKETHPASEPDPPDHSLEQAKNTTTKK